MALRDQPYFPLYVQDFLTDEKLNECSAAAVGVYIKVMCLMHKQEIYGKILLKQKDKQVLKQIAMQNEEQIIFFALKLAKLLPFDFDTILASLTELIDEKVLHFEGDFLIQKRMVYDNDLSVKRAESGSEGGKRTQLNNKKNKKFALAKTEANSEYENEYENEYEIIGDIWGVGKKEDLTSEQKIELELVEKMVEIWTTHNPDYFLEADKDYPACLKLAYQVGKTIKIKKVEILKGEMKTVLSKWLQLVLFAKSDSFYASFSLSKIQNNYQAFIQTFNSKSDLFIDKSVKVDPF